MIATAICVAILILREIYAPEAQLSPELAALYVGVFMASLISDVGLTLKKLTE